MVDPGMVPRAPAGRAGGDTGVLFVHGRLNGQSTKNANKGLLRKIPVRPVPLEVTAHATGDLELGSVSVLGDQLPDLPDLGLPDQGAPKIDPFTGPAAPGSPHGRWLHVQENLSWVASVRRQISARTHSAPVPWNFALALGCWCWCWCWRRGYHRSWSRRHGRGRRRGSGGVGGGVGAGLGAAKMSSDSRDSEKTRKSLTVFYGKDYGPFSDRRAFPRQLVPATAFRTARPSSTARGIRRRARASRISRIGCPVSSVAGST